MYKIFDMRTCGLSHQIKGCVQELATFLGPQNRTQGRCDAVLHVLFNQMINAIVL